MRASGGTAGRAFWAGLVVILALAAVLRVYDVGDLPAGFFCDEAGNGYNGYLLATTAHDENREFLPLYIWSFGVSYKNPLFIYASAIPISLFGLSEFSVRLTAAIFGILAVLGIGLLGRTVFGAAGGLLAALLLAVVPWHVHFSRIGFELIAFPTVFLFACAALAVGVRGRPRWLLLAGPLFALCFYAYVPSKLFVPFFLLGAGVVYARRLWAVRGTVALAALLTVLAAAPVVVFDITHRDRSQLYFSRTTTLNAGQTVAENASRVFDQYRRFFSQSFLLERGDPLLRHAVPGFGELYWAMVPLLALGVLWCLWPGRPEGKLFLWWLLLYPVAPALMNEAPSASRGFIGVAAFCLIAAAGGTLVLAALRRILPWPKVALAAQVVAAAVLLVALGREAWRYGEAYVTVYPGQAAAEFQYGYREAIAFMEQHRGEYDLLMLTANRVNQPQIFAAFYNAERPGGPPAGRESGYLIIDPSEYGRYEMNQRILAALREDDLRLFEDYEELHRVHQPNGRVEYVIAAPRTRRRFLREWLLLGPFDNTANQGVARAFVDPADPQGRAYDGLLGPAYWRRVTPQFVKVDFNAFYRQSADQAGKPLEWTCGYAVTQLDVDAPRHAMLQLAAPVQTLQAWVNGRPLMEKPITVAPEPRGWPIQLQAGANEVLVKVCKTVGEWSFTARVTDDQGRDLPGVTVRPSLDPPALAAAPQAPAQLVDGFGAALSANRRSDLFADYRGDAKAWWEALEDPNGAVVWTTDPVPERAPTAFVFTAMMSEEPGTAELWVNRRYALTFSTGRFQTAQRWQRGPYVLEYEPRERGHFLSGVWRLQVPAEEITPGQPVELRVAHVDGRPFAFFQLKGRDDTAVFEGVTLADFAAPPPPAPAEPPAAAPPPAAAEPPA